MSMLLILTNILLMLDNILLMLANICRGLSGLGRLQYRKNLAEILAFPYSPKKAAVSCQKSFVIPLIHVYACTCSYSSVHVS